MKKTLIFTVMALALLLVAAGCKQAADSSSDVSVVGTWVYSDASTQTTLTLTCLADGSFTEIATFPAPTPPQTLTGTYTISGNQVTFSFSGTTDQTVATINGNSLTVPNTGSGGGSITFTKN